MKHAIIVVAICAGWSLSLAQSMPSHGPATQGATEGQAQSLTHSAISLVHSPTGISHRAGRLVLDMQYAHQLAPRDSEVNELQQSIFEIQGKMADAAEAAEAVLAANPDDYATGLSCLRLRLAALSNAQSRLSYLHEQAGNEKLNPYVRAQAYVQAARIQLGKDEKKAAAADYEAALKLDPLLGAALAGRLALQSEVSDADRARTLLDMIKGSPTDTDALWQAGMLLNSLGIYDKSLEFLSTAWRLMGQRSSESLTQNPTMAIQYFNAMLDARQYRGAIETFGPLMKNLGQGPELLSLMVEAYRGMGDETKAREVLGTLQTALTSDEATTNDPAGAAKQTAWYYLVNDFRVYSTLSYAKSATAKEQNQDDAMELILGAAQLKADQPEIGEKRLLKLADQDAYANAFLAEYYYQTNQPERGKDALLAGAKLTHRGRAWRRIAALADRQNVALPKAPHMAEVEAQVAKFDGRYLQMSLAPAQFMEIRVQPTQESYGCAEPIMLTATLSNTSEVDIPLGTEGLFNPTMSLEASATTRLKDSFVNLPLLRWKANRYLRPGESVEAKVRLDVGDLERYLLQRPFADITIQVTPTLDPVQGPNGLRSSLPAYTLGKATIVRSDILGKFDRQKADWTQQYQWTLGYIVKDLKQGDQSRRMLAARTIGSLLMCYADSLTNKTALPAPLMTKVKLPVLLAMMRAALQDVDPAVRGEMLASMVSYPPDDITIRLLQPLAKDDSPLVRYRLCEYVGVADVANLKTWLHAFRTDKDANVQKMAALFAK